MTKLRNNDGPRPHPWVDELAAMVPPSRDRAARLPAHDRPPWHFGRQCQSLSRRHRRRLHAGAGRGARAQDGRHLGRFAMQDAGDHRPGLVQLDRGQRHHPQLHRVPDLRRSRQRRPPVSRRQLVALGRPQDVELQAASRHQVVQRRRLHHRRRRVQLQALARPQVEIGQPDAVRRSRVREDRPARLQAPSGAVEDVAARGALRLYLCDRAQGLRRAGRRLEEEPDRDGPLQPRRVPDRQDRPGDQATGLLGASRPTSTRSSTSTSAPRSRRIWQPWRPVRSTSSIGSPRPSSISPSGCPWCRSSAHHRR